MENAVIVVEVLRPSLPSLVSLVPSLVCVSKKTLPVGSKSRGACMNHPHHFCGGVSNVDTTAPRTLIYKMLFSSISTFETLPCPVYWPKLIGKGLPLALS